MIFSSNRFYLHWWQTLQKPIDFYYMLHLDGLNGSFLLTLLFTISTCTFGIHLTECKHYAYGNGEEKWRKKRKCEIQQIGAAAYETYTDQSNAKSSCSFNSRPAEIPSLLRHLLAFVFVHFCTNSHFGYCDSPVPDVHHSIIIIAHIPLYGVRSLWYTHNTKCVLDLQGKGVGDGRAYYDITSISLSTQQFRLWNVRAALSCMATHNSIWLRCLDGAKCSVRYAKQRAHGVGGASGLGHVIASIRN